jgi:hypothetical protein
MKKILTLAFTMLLAASLSFAQGTTGSSGSKTETPKTESGKKAKTKSHSKKGGKKSKGKKSAGGTTTPPPK